MQPKIVKLPNIGIGVAAYFAVLLAFWTSSQFSIHHEQYQLISVVASVVISAVLVFHLKVLLPIVLAFLSYYLHVGRPFEVALLYALLLPLLPVATALLFIQIEKRLEGDSAMKRLLAYAVTFGLFYPLMSTLMISVISALTEQLHMTREFLLYSVLGSALTQLTVTPALVILLAMLLKNERHEYLILDKLLRRSSKTSPSYWLWLLCCFSLMAVAIQHPSSFALYSSCFVLLVLVIVGFGKHGLVRPLFMGTLTILVMANDSLNRVNTYQILDEQFFGLLLILNVVTVLGYFVGGYAIKHYELAQQQIRAERIDPYTGLFNLSQLEEDLTTIPKAVLIYLDLSPTLSRLSELGHDGKAQLIGQIYQFVNRNQDENAKCYRPPFSTGVLGFIEGDERMKPFVAEMAQRLDNFQFYWRGTSISLVSPTLHCVVVKHGEDLTDVVSHLCEHQGSNQQVNWIDGEAIAESQIDKLAYIQRVFKNNEFELYCQRYMKLADPSSQQLSFEVLTRVKTSQDCRLLPSEFFPLINQFGLEVQLDQWVVEQTFRLLSEQVRHWCRVEKCAVNLTARSLAMAGLSTWIIEKAHQYQVPLDKICFEVTESSALQNEEQAIETLKVLRAAGCKIALDDFGTGYASFAYLRRLPLDIVKIDGEFIKDLPTNETDRLIVESISNVANDIGLETVAEFVESEQHIEMLKQWHITYAQGFGVYKPQPLAQVLREFETSSVV
ncbi:EAL domain-containing protein [Vibrio vulnificus]|uniref:EAL domain-containing protein n=1 Tax=Vibrio vulnificus TaxID=672 RepID=UPI0028C87259|nr:EAL domain-containing protein [Vibrio vulnificus]